MFVLVEIGQLVTESDPPERERERELLRTGLQPRLESNLGKVILSTRARGACGRPEAEVVFVAQMIRRCLSKQRGHRCHSVMPDDGGELGGGGSTSSALTAAAVASVSPRSVSCWCESMRSR
jgi:hypothetical protein